MIYSPINFEYFKNAPQVLEMAYEWKSAKEHTINSSNLYLSKAFLRGKTVTLPTIL